MKIELTPPNVSSFIKSLRDIGYTFEVAVADILDNSISARANNVEIYCVESPHLVFCMLDDGKGMDEEGLREAMRLSSNDPDSSRGQNDLGRFGLGLKTASFSQCSLLTLISKSTQSQISAKQWNIDQVINLNQWALNSLNKKDIENIIQEAGVFNLYEKLRNQKSGTIVVWQNIDRINANSLALQLDVLREHLSLVFHRFIDGEVVKKVNFSINNSKIIGFNPFYNSDEQEKHKPVVNKKDIWVQPYIMPSFRQVTKEVYNKYGTSSGYSRSQGCYLYRANRLIAQATWWRIIKNEDSNQLVRIKIDICNNQDKEWGVTVTKSGYGVTPPIAIREELKIIFREITRRGRNTQVARKRNNSQERFWEISRKDKINSFRINKKHPLLHETLEELNNEESKAFLLYLNSLEAYLPVEAIHREMINKPHDLKQKTSIDSNQLDIFVEKLREKGLSKDDIENFIKAEGFDKEMFNDA